jgi:UDP-glucose 4-epimerase
MRILITGASGFLGRRLLVSLTNKGHSIIAITRRQPTHELKDFPGIEWIICDLAYDKIDISSVDHIDVVIHLAGSYQSDDESDYFINNEQATFRLLQVVAKRVNRFIFASSQVVYGSPNCLHVDENYLLSPENSSYAASKINCENWMRYFQKKFGGNYIALRLCGFIDGGGFVDYLINSALNSNTIELFSNGVVHRDYLHSEDGITALVAALNSPYRNCFEAINIGSGKAPSSHFLARSVCDELNSCSNIIFSSIRAPQSNFVYNINRAKNILKFEPESLIKQVKKYAKMRKHIKENNCE